MLHEGSSQFLNVKSGDYVLINDYQEFKLSNNQHLLKKWIGQVISCIGGARDPNAWTLFQVINIDNGEVSIINADNVVKILK